MQQTIARKKKYDNLSRGFVAYGYQMSVDYVFLEFVKETRIVETQEQF
jgi:hypothetical protein